MRTRVGLFIARDVLRAVALRRGRVLWAVEAEVERDEPLGDAVRAFVRSVPVSRVVPAATVAVLASPFAQRKMVMGLPRTTDMTLLAAAVRENTDHFFAWHGRSVLTGRVHVDATGCTWATAYDAQIVQSVVAACSGTGLRVKAVLADAALDDVVIGSLAEAVGTDAHRFAVPHAAAAGGEREPTRLMLDGGTGERASVPRWRTACASAALVVSAVAVALTSGLAARRDEARARAAIGALSAHADGATGRERELQRVSSMLDTIARFRAERTSALELLGELTVRLPDDAAVTTMRIDSTRGSLVAVAPRGGALIGRLDRSALFTTVSLVGPVSRDVVAGHEMERVTIAFIVSRRASDATRSQESIR